MFVSRSFVRIFESYLLVPMSMSWSHHLPNSQPCSHFLPIHPPISSHLPSIVPFPCPCPIYVQLSLPLSSRLKLSHHPCPPPKTPSYHTCQSNLLSKLSSPPFLYVNCASNCVYVCMFCYGMLCLQSHCFQLFTNYNGNESTMVHSRCKFK